MGRNPINETSLIKYLIRNSRTFSLLMEKENKNHENNPVYKHLSLNESVLDFNLYVEADVKLRNNELKGYKFYQYE